MVGEAVNIDLYESWLSVKTKEFEVWPRYRSVNIKPLFNQNEWLDVLLGPLLPNIIEIHSHPGLGDYFQLVDVEPDISVVKLDQAASRPLQPIRKDLVIRFRRQRLAREAIMAAKEISV